MSARTVREHLDSRPGGAPGDPGGRFSPREDAPWSDAPTQGVERTEPVSVGPWGLPTVIADLAESLTATPEKDFGSCIVQGLQALGQALQMEWAAVRCPAIGTTSSPASHEWRRDPDAPSLNGGLLMCLLPTAPAEGPGVSLLNDGQVGSAREALAERGFRFTPAFPVPLGGGRRGVLVFGASAPDHHWSPTIITQLRIAAAVFGQALTYQDARPAPALEPRDSLHSGHGGPRDNELDRSRMPAQQSAPALRLQHEDECRREGMQERVGAGAIVGRSAAIRAVLAQLQQVAGTDSTVLLLGETGTGKELLATQIHDSSARRGRSMVRINCAAIPSTLIESELFGREKGAFTGALSRQIGRFETADRSSIFLDEIGDLPPEVQVKLLRVLEERRIERLGSPRSLAVDVRIIAATHRDLEKRMAEDEFREDLFYRLNVFPIRVPALRDRAEDIPLLVWRFVIEFSRVFGKRIDAISRESIALMQRYHWPGNIRELRNVVERAMIVASGPTLTIALPATAPPAGPVPIKLDEVEREHIRAVLERVRWRIRGTGGAAEQLGLRPTTLETRMTRLGLNGPRTA